MGNESFHNFFDNLKTTVDFCIIRHGQSEGNAGQILQGRGEYPLSETGRLQAAARGRSIKAALESLHGKALLFSSPQGRASETALIIAEEAGLPEPVFMDELMEMSLGIWTGKVWDEVRDKEPSLWADFRARSWDAIPGAESSTSLYDRALRAWAALCAAAAAQSAEKVIAVSHGGLIQWLLRSSFQCRTWFPLFHLSNCGLSRLHVEPTEAGQGAIQYWEEIDTPLPL